MSGGAWTAGATGGRYRVIVVTEGWEEVRRRAFVEWLEERDPRDAGGAGGAASHTAARTTADLNVSATIFALSDPRLVTHGGRWYVTACGAERPLVPYTRPVAFELGAPGRVRRVPLPRRGSLTRRCS